MSTLDLTGLKGNSPLGFLAAVGLLRICTQHLKLDGQLSWQNPADPSATASFWYAKLEVPGVLTEPAELYRRLLEVLKTRRLAAEFLQDQNRRYSLTSLGAYPGLLWKMLNSASFLNALLDEFPDLASADAILSDDRFAKIANLMTLATAGLDETDRQGRRNSFVKAARARLEKMLKPLREFPCLADSVQIKRLRSEKFLEALVERFSDIKDANEFFIDPRTTHFFSVLDRARPTNRRNARPLKEEVCERLQKTLARRAEADTESALDHDDEDAQSNRYFFTDNGILTGIPDPFVALSVFRSWVDSTLGRQMDDDQSRFLSFLAGYGAPVPPKGREVLSASALIMLSGQQRLFNCILDIPEKCSLEDIQEVLHGPWKRSDPRSPLGLDTEVIQSHATSAMDPSKAGQRRTALAVWLAIEALPLFPVIPVAHNECRTPAFDRAGSNFRHMVFAWPVWTPPLSLNVVFDLIAHLSKVMPTRWEGGSRQDPQKFALELRDRGIAALFASGKQQNGKYFTFLPAKRMF